MNFNASRNVQQSGGIRKAKRVSDVAAMGTPSPAPTFSPGPAYSPGYPAVQTGPPPPYSEGIQLDTSQDYVPQGPVPSFGYMAGGYPQSPVSPTQIGAMLQQPVVQDMALQYGDRLAREGGAVVARELGRLVPVSRLRYYFAVDTRYVLHKLLLLAFPYTHKDWMVKYDQDLPVQPRYDINAPDLYIPCMGYVTYVLLAGFMLGLQHRFSPEQISIQASSALAHMLCEVLLYGGALYAARAGAALGALELLAFAGYKYGVMVAALLAALLAAAPGYYAVLLFGCLSLSYFLVKTLRLQLQPAEAAGEARPYAYGAGAGAGAWGGGGSKRRLYFLLLVALTQPLLCWWLTRHLLPPTPAPGASPLAPMTPLAPAR